MAVAILRLHKSRGVAPGTSGIHDRVTAKKKMKLRFRKVTLPYCGKISLTKTRHFSHFSHLKAYSGLMKLIVLCNHNHHPF